MLPPGPRCRASRSRPTSGAMSTRSHACGSAGPPTSSWSRRPRPTSSPGRTASRTTCSPTLLTARCPWCSRPRCTPRCGEHAATTANVATLPRARCPGHRGRPGRLTGKDTGRAAPRARRIFDARREVLAQHLAAMARPGARPRGRHVVVSAGGTGSTSTRPVPRQPLLGPPGYALARSGWRAAPRSPSWRRTPASPTRPG